MLVWWITGLALANPFDRCLVDHPLPDDSRQFSACVYWGAMKNGDIDAGIALLETLVAEHPDNGFVLVTLGNLYNKSDDVTRAPAPWNQAIAIFATQDDVEGQVFALLNLSNWHGRRGDLPAGSAALDRAWALVEAADDDGLRLRVGSQLARWYFHVVGDLHRAHAHAHEVWEVVRHQGPEGYQLQSFSLSVLIGVYHRLNRRELERRHRAELLAIVRAHGDRNTEANAVYNALDARLQDWLADGSPEADRGALVAEFDALVTLAGEAGSRGNEAMALCASGLVDPDRADAFERGRDLAEAEREPRLLWACDLARARSLAASDPAEALELAREARQQAAASGNRGDAIQAQYLSVQLLAGVEPQRVAEAAEALLNAIELQADVQKDEISRLHTLSLSAAPYYDVAAQKLAEGDDAGAFAVTERLRARELLLQLEVEGEDRFLDPATTEALDAITALQAKLIEGSVDDTERALGQLEALELAARGHRDAARRTTGAGRSQATGPELLAAVQATLSPDEALVAYQLPPTDPDRLSTLAAWAWVVTPTALVAVPMPSRARLADQVAMFQGLFEARSGVEAIPSARLHADLVAPVLAALPRPPRRLVLIADGPLHRLAFAALRPTEQGPPLGTTTQLARAPSATLWLRWRRQHVAPGEALVLADPTHPGLGGGASLTRGLRWDELGSLGALPHARTEARAVARQTGAVVWLGDDAGEAQLKARDLAGVGLLHFAAHAVADARYPDRSAVLLAPGGPEQDGLLQAREIADLALPGSLVVLSACRSATGTLLAGEGVIGLSRSFVQAGVHGVIGSLWPLRDEEAAAFFTGFYAHLGDGLSVGEALQRTRRDRQAAGAPAAEWAGLVLIGDGELAPVEGTPRALWPWLVAGFILLGAAFLARRLGTAT